ncbi:unnamed protein product [Phytophthora lilii]|uniref:Unnamed protein product n=1 Tax=Phytophthora lilii TaxID=2077276 RepID=A0A9W7CMW9_9STRA|nr:unnamed protein product [Phytophthora lilii]
MRYSSSRAAVSSGYSGGGGGGYSSYGGGRSSSSSGLHYTKSGALDMRYSSSKAAVSSSYGGSSTSYARPASSHAPALELHYTKSGALDMRYASSQASVAQAAAAPAARPANSNLHYTKSGALDMRYKSSQAVAQKLNKAAPPPAPSSSNLHYTKSGALDMRYKSSHDAVGTAVLGNAPDDNLHYTKSGALDMRYKSSREVVQKMEKLGLNQASKSKKAAKPQKRAQGVPNDLPVTKAGTPDLRTTKAKQWVQSQAQRWHPADALPAWVPCLIARHDQGSVASLYRWLACSCPTRQAR